LFEVYDAVKLNEIYTMYFLRFFKNKRIVMYDTLIDQVELPELLAILGHEIGHWQLSHALQGFVVVQVNGSFVPRWDDRTADF
jgi:STE24 endopeptidase